MTKMFGLNLVFVVGDYNEFRNYVKFHDDYDIGKKDCGGMYVYTDEKDGEMKRYLWVPSKDFTSNGYGTLCHELHHFTHQSLGDRGITYGTAGEELFAYFQGYFMELVVKAMVELDRIEKLEFEKLKNKKDVKLHKTRRR